MTWRVKRGIDQESVGIRYAVEAFNQRNHSSVGTSVKEKAIASTATTHGKTFLLKVQGDSMRDARIFDGDLLLVTVQPEAHPGEIVVAMVEDEVTVKRFQMDGTTVVLKPENEAFAPIRITPAEQRFRILGKVIGVFRKL